MTTSARNDKDKARVDDDAPWMTEEHAMLGDMVRRFLAAELTPNIERWEKQGLVDLDFWRKAGDLGLLGAAIPQDFDGSGGDNGHDLVALPEQAAAADTG